MARISRCGGLSLADRLRPEPERRAEKLYCTVAAAQALPGSNVRRGGVANVNVMMTARSAFASFPVCDAHQPAPNTLSLSRVMRPVRGAWQRAACLHGRRRRETSWRKERRLQFKRRSRFYELRAKCSLLQFVERCRHSLLPATAVPLITFRGLGRWSSRINGCPLLNLLQTQSGCLDFPSLPNAEARLIS